MVVVNGKIKFGRRYSHRYRANAAKCTPQIDHAWHLLIMYGTCFAAKNPDLLRHSSTTPAPATKTTFFTCLAWTSNLQIFVHAIWFACLSFRSSINISLSLQYLHEEWSMNKFIRCFFFLFINRPTRSMAHIVPIFNSYWARTQHTKTSQNETGRMVFPWLKGTEKWLQRQSSWNSVKIPVKA